MDEFNDDKRFKRLRSTMVNKQLESRGIDNREVLDAFRKVPRHIFVPRELASSAYDDRALPLGPDQTISQPYTIALMMQALKLTRDEVVLEIGSGSGYVACMLGELAKEVHSVEIDHELTNTAQRNLELLGSDNVHIHSGDGYAGLPEHAPFDAIVVSAAPDHIPRDLIKQLKNDGRMVLPLGERDGVQELVLIQKTESGLQTKELGGVRFVPLKIQD